MSDNANEPQVKVDLSGLNPNQRAIASTLDAPLFVEAGAGSGKTFTLTQRITWALAPGSGPDGRPFLDDLGQVLVITFTEAAAREIRERVRANLRRAGMGRQALAVDDAWISTIHGMCSRILHRHALDLGLDPDFGVVMGSEQERLFFQAMEEECGAARRDPAFAPVFADKGMGTYSPVSGYSGAMETIRSVIAAASALPEGLDGLECARPRADGDGSLASLMRELLMRFEELGAEKLSASAASKVGPALEALRAFDALAPGARTPEAAMDALAQVEAPRPSKAIADKLADAKTALAFARAEAAFAAAAEGAPALLELARRVERRYRELKEQGSVLDNDDLVKLALRAVRDVPEVRRDYAGRFRLVMVDEFQDTDEAQLALIELLSGEGARHLCTVGDAQQSIYRFRGADVGVFYRRGEGVGPEGRVRLDVNYRSHGDVLKFVERVGRGAASGLGAGGGPSGTMERFMHLDDCPTRKDALKARDLPRVDVEVVCGQGASGHATAHQSAAMAALVADALASYRDHGERPGDMALLLGVTTHADLYIDAIRARGIECVVTGGSTFTSTPEVGAVCALLHTLANPSDTQSGLFPLLASEVFGLDANDFCELGTRVLEKTGEPAKRPIEQGLSEPSGLSGHEGSLRLRRAREVLSGALGRAATEPVADVVADVARDSGWLARLESQGARGLARAANVLAAIRYVRDLTQSLGLGPARAAVEFDNWLAASKIAPASLAGADGGEGGGTLRVMTIHASKGLEFPVTAVAECWGNPREASQLAVLPPKGEAPAELVLRPAECPKLDGVDACELASDLEEGRDLGLAGTYVALRELGARAAAQEKARLLYVAMTRAREALILGVSAQGGKGGLSSGLAADAMFALFGAADAPAPGISSVDYGGEAPARVRTVRVEAEGKGAEKRFFAESAGAMPALDGELPADASLLPRLAAGEGAGAAPGEAVGGEAPEPFDLYGVEGPLDAPLDPWSAREGVYSYSSVRRAQAAESSPRPPVPTREEREAADAGAPVDGDADKATHLGSAFHELAQAMAESGRPLGEARVDAACRRWNLSGRARGRLARALALWEGSSIRAEALSHGRVLPEQPFFAHEPSEHGEYLEGAIDLLCLDEGASSALVVDYKTGDGSLTPAQVREAHAMQAAFYAQVLLDQGFSRVECAFVCVEREDPERPGEPLCVRYGFPS